MDSEKIIRLWRFAYVKIFDVDDPEKKWVYFKDKKGSWDCTKIFWRFYWLRRSL